MDFNADNDRTFSVGDFVLDRVPFLGRLVVDFDFSSLLYAEPPPPYHAIWPAALDRQRDNRSSAHSWQKQNEKNSK